MKQLKIGERITALRSKSISTYFSEVEKIPMLSTEKEFQVSIKAHAGDKASIDLLVKSNLRFVISVAKMYDNNKGKVLDDLIAVGNVGLMEAAEKFDPSRGFKFISFAVWYIRKEMLKYLNDHSHIAKIPITHKHIQRKVREISGNLFAKEGREPTEQELLESLRGSLKNLKGLQMEVMKNAISVGEYHTSLDAPLEEDGEITLLDTITNTEFDYDPYDQEEIKKTLEQIMKCLTPLERASIEKKFLNESIEKVQGFSAPLETGFDRKVMQATVTRALKKLHRQSKRVKNPFKV